MGLRCSTHTQKSQGSTYKRIANILADSVSRLKAVGICHDIDPNDYQQELSTPFKPQPPVEPVANTPVEVNEVVIVPDIEKCTQAYDTLHYSPTERTRDEVKCSLKMHHLQTYHSSKRT